MANFVESHPFVSAGIALGALIVLALLIVACSDKPSKEEIEYIVQDVEDQEQREKFIRLLSDDNARDALKELLTNAA